MRRQPIGGMRVLCLAILIAGPMEAFSETSNHERLGVEGPKVIELETSLALDLYPSLLGGSAALGFDVTFGFEALIARSFGIAIDVPAVAALALETDAEKRVGAAQGDPRIALSYSFRRTAYRYAAELSYRHPLGVFTESAVNESGLATGSGHPTLGVSFYAVRFMDPLVLMFGLRAKSGFTRKEPYGSSVRPLDLSLDAGLTEALNDRASLSWGLSATFDAPRLSEGASDGVAWSYDLEGSASLTLSRADRRFVIGISKSLVDPYSAASLSISLTRTFTAEQ